MMRRLTIRITYCYPCTSAKLERHSCNHSFGICHRSPVCTSSHSTTETASRSTADSRRSSIALRCKTFSQQMQSARSQPTKGRTFLQLCSFAQKSKQCLICQQVLANAHDKRITTMARTTVAVGVAVQANARRTDINNQCTCSRMHNSNCKYRHTLTYRT